MDGLEASMLEEDSPSSPLELFLFGSLKLSFPCADTREHLATIT